MHKTVVINAVGLTPSVIGDHTPRLRDFASSRRIASITPPLPAVTCTSQATFLTGTHPDEHGIVGNGWYFRDECEIKFWRQSNRLVQRPKLWDELRKLDPGGFTCANLFWWFNMYSTVDIAVTPRPMYPADGRKIPDIHTNPATLRGELQSELGPFPLFHFWGPAADIRSTRWIVDATLLVAKRFDPTLMLVYLPHLDYDFQRFGPDSAQAKVAAQQLDAEIGRLLDFYEQRGHRVVVLSEYGITPVNRPVHLNRELRKHGLLAVRDELGHELLDAGASAAFAVADHQVAHVYLNNPQRREAVRRILESTSGVAKVYEGDERSEIHLAHPRAGDFVVLAEPDAWFTYYYWMDESAAPDFVHSVDIHRKPGYDPVELFIDPKIASPKLKIGWSLLKRKLGFRSLMDVIGTDASLVRGSHGLLPPSREAGPLLIGDRELLQTEELSATDIFGVLKNHVLADSKKVAATDESNTRHAAANKQS